MNKHLFAFYKKDLHSLIPSAGGHAHKTVSFKDADLHNRLTKIVRIKPGDRFILFDEKIQVTCCATEMLEKRVVSGSIEKQAVNKPLSPPITLLLPILKKEALEYAVYVAAQMGVQEIIFIPTTKSQRLSSPRLSSKQTLPVSENRLHSIVIAACEQSKNFIFPKLTVTNLEFPQILQKFSDTSTKIWLHETGDPIQNLFNKTGFVKTGFVKNIVLTLGPEGGFSQAEEKILHDAHFSPYKLTPTILRSREALCVGLGVIRSV